MSKIQFQTAATPTMSPEEFETNRLKTSGKFISTPGTYSLVVKGVEVKGANQYDSQWVDLIFALEDSNGASLNHYVSIPTTAEKSFLFGPKKTLYAYNDLDRLLKGFGVALEYTNAINQIESLFSDAEATFIGQTVTMRLGFKTNYAHYVGKVDDVAQYVIVDKDGKPIDGRQFKGIDTLKAYADENKIKIQSFIRVLDVVANTTTSIATSAAKLDLALPF